METTGERIAAALAKLGRSKAWLSEQVGISRTAMGKIVNDETRTSKYLPAIAKALSVPISSLTDAGFVEQIEAWDSATPLHDDDVELPLFREVELSAGSGRTEVIENHGAKLRFAKSSLAKQNVSPDHAACCFVSGDSMEPTLSDGSTVGIDTAQTNVIDGKMYAIDYAGMLRIKQLYRVPGGIKVRSINRDYDDETVTGDALESFRVIGKVFWSASFHN